MPQLNLLRLMIFFVTSVCLVIGFVVASYTDPGVVPLTEKDFYVTLRNVEGPCDQSEEIKTHFCRTCKTEKPMRSKHCSVLNRCVAEFDHFCPWCNNAVGSKNYMGFMTWCTFEFLCHAQILHILYTYLLAQVEQDSIFPVFATVQKFNAVAPTVFYLFLFNAMSLLMALQLTLFNGNNISANVTTNERMNAQRYDYLKDHLPSLSGNPFDRGGFVPNFKYMWSRGFIPASFDVKYQRLSQNDQESGLLPQATIPVLEGTAFDRFFNIANLAGVDPNRASSVLVAGEAQRWVITQMERLQQDQMLNPADRDMHTKTLQDLMLGTMRYLASFSEERQKKLLGILNGDGHQAVRGAGHIGDQVLAAVKMLNEMDPVEGTKGTVTFDQPEPEQGAGNGGSTAGEAASPEDAAGSPEQAQQAYMLKQQRLIAREVLTAEQLSVFNDEQEKMDAETDPKRKAECTKTAQKKLAAMLTDIQTDKIRLRMKEEEKKWRALQPPEEQKHQHDGGHGGGHGRGHGHGHGHSS